MSNTKFAGALLTDALLVVLFAVLGRNSHELALTPAGVFDTAWPFLAALALGWLVTLAWRSPVAPVRTGLPIWVITAGGGLLLRLASGQGAALPFVIVAVATLALMLVGWRLVATLIRRRQSRRDGEEELSQR